MSSQEILSGSTSTLLVRLKAGELLSVRRMWFRATTMRLRALLGLLLLAVAQIAKPLQAHLDIHLTLHQEIGQLALVGVTMSSQEILSGSTSTLLVRLKAGELLSV